MCQWSYLRNVGKKTMVSYIKRKIKYDVIFIFMKRQKEENFILLVDRNDEFANYVNKNVLVVLGFLLF
jgi:hypothetical protein